MARVKVVHIITKLELGGAQQNTLFTVSHLDNRRYEPILISGSDGQLVDDARGLNGVGLFLMPELVREIHPCKDLLALCKLVGLLRRLKDDNRCGGSSACREIIVHTHSSKAGILGRWAAKLAGIKYIIHSVHGFSFHDFQPAPVKALYIFLERLTACITTAFIVVSRANRDEGIQKEIFSADKVLLIRSGIDIDEFKAVQRDRKAAKAKIGMKRDIPLVGMIACFKPQKAPLDFIRVARLILDKRDEVQFLLVGDGKLRPQIEEEIRALGLTDHVRLAGWRRDIPMVMQAMDVLVLTSLWEGLPRVIPQAMAAGIPVVATGVNGSCEAVRDGVSGFVVPPRDVRAMADRVIYVLTHPEQAHHMGEQGRAMVQEYDIWKMLEQQEKLYADLVGANRIEDQCQCV